MKNRTDIASTILASALGLSLLGVVAWQMSQRTQQLIDVRVMQVAASDDTSVILPQDSVKFDDKGQPFVLLLDQNRMALPYFVTASSWRRDFYRVDGLRTNDLVVLDNRVAVGQMVNYSLINPEAGQSGLVER